MPTNNIIVLDSYFNLTNKSNLTDKLKYDLIRFFDQLVVAYFFGPPCIYEQLTQTLLLNIVGKRLLRTFLGGKVAAVYR